MQKCRDLILKLDIGKKLMDLSIPRLWLYISQQSSTHVDFNT